MSQIFSEGSGAGGGREKGAPERRVVGLKRSANGKNLRIMMLFEGSITDVTIGLLLGPICHEGVWDGTRHWPRS